MSSTAAAPARPEGPSGRTAALVLVAAVLVAMLALPVRAWFLQQAQIADARGALSSLEEQIGDLEEQQRQWKDPAFLEEQARLRLNYVSPGEAGIVVLRPAESQESAQESATWFDSLWQTVDSAAGRGTTTLGDPVQVRESAPR
jgi:cell division protein FtsB